MANSTTFHPRVVMWRRIDVEGMDVCSYCPSGDGHAISGTALFLEGGEPARFDYEVSCAPDWSSRSARICGWLGSKKLEMFLSRDPAGAWTVNGKEIGGVAGLADIDLGFTPATNTNAIRRLRLAVGEEAESTAVWLDTRDWRFKPLRQVYRRLSQTGYAYRSPLHGYAANLETDDFGIIRSYPQLWTAICQPDARESLDS